LLSLSDVLAWLRDEQVLARALRWIAPGSAALATLLFGYEAGVMAASGIAPLLAAATVVAGVLTERATNIASRRVWWAVPAACPLILLPAAILGQPVIGLTLAGAYMTVTLALAIEGLRKRANG
jgi:hypothetical protein